MMSNLDIATSLRRRRCRRFRLRAKLTKLCRWISLPGFHNPPPSRRNPICKILNLARQRLRHLKPGRHGYVRVGHDPGEKGPSLDVPKGHMAVYVVGQSGGDARRVVVPVMYFNHPLFGDLLREAELVYGYDHPGGITLPCGISELERVQTRIAAVGGGIRRLTGWGRRS
ncbi:auxin-responsive protein SAUR36 isoform X2 [Rhodamnia argentea]|uniref:Auxin-responsive protein SAUR36 isoform X2 n=1 Tax=Rhodamnia argentea TaxID=178133 RepID=A0ABM3HX55_9MYRT|nr:auxin-responsive protein SAUR36 isoform X2 [Rhodamnia argentea]